MADRSEAGGYQYTRDERQRWECPSCDHAVLVLTSDPFYPDELVCIECDEQMERDVDG